MPNPYSRHLSTGEFTWFYVNTSGHGEEIKWLICFQWLNFQGSEFHLEFESKKERDQAFMKLKEEFAPDYVLSTLDSNTTYSRPNLSVETKKLTMTPVMMRMMFSAPITVTPTGYISRQFFDDILGIDTWNHKSLMID